MCQRLIPAVLQVFSDSWLNNHPLAVGLSSKDFQKFHLSCCKLSPELEQDFIGVIVKEEGLCSNNSSLNLFVTVKTKTNIFSESEECDYLPLYVTYTFLRHYGLENNDVFCFKTASCLPIEKLVLGAKCENSYEWSKSQNWHEKLLVASLKRKLLCRIGDVLLIPPEVLLLEENKISLLFDFVVIECFPVGQGILTTNTIIVVIDNSEISTSLENDFKENAFLNGAPQLQEDMISCLHLMNFTSHLLLPGSLQTMPFSGNTVINGFASASNTLLKSLRHRFKVQIIPKLSEEMKDAVYSDNTEDSLNKVFITNSAFQRIGMAQGAWIKIKLFYPCNQVRRCCSIPLSNDITSNGELTSSKQRHSSGNSDMTKEMKINYRLATVFPLSCVKSHCYNDDVALITPHLWFNLNSHPSTLLQPHTHMIIEPLPSESNVSPPPYAKEIYVALIQSPNYNGNISCNTILQRYFSSPRYVCKGDILAVKTRGDIIFQPKLDDPLNTNLPIIYFRVSMIEKFEGSNSTAGYLADREHTRIYQSGTTQTFIPVTMETYYSLCPPHPLWDIPSPPGLEYYIRTIEELVIPFLKFQNKKFQVNSNILLSGLPSCGKTVAAKAVCKCLNLHFYQVNCHEFMGESPATVETKLRGIVEKASVYVPCVMLLKNIDFIGKEKEVHSGDPRVLSTLSELLKNINSSGVEWPVITIATTSEKKLLSSDLSSAFLHHVHMQPPNEEERSLILSDLLSSCILSNDILVSYFAQRTAGFVLGSLCLLVSDAKRIAFSRARKLVGSNFRSSVKDEIEVFLSGVPIIQEDLLCSLEKLHSSHAESIGAPQVPNIQWEDVGGLSEVKQEILDTIQLPLEHPEIAMCGLQRSGVLLYGPPGTGKTLLAKAVATECSLNFLSVKGPELINMYVGQSEENIREVFNRARGAVPCVIFFDELDSLAPNRGRSGDSGGVMDRVVSQLLAELDGLNKASDVFVIGATNRPDLIDPALLRPGRFDRHLFVGIPEDKMSRVNIMKALTRKFILSSDVNLSSIVDRCPQYLSGADFYSLCCDAMMSRIEKNIMLIEQGSISLDAANLILQSVDFDTAIESLLPSVTPDEFMRFKELKSTM